MQTFLPLPDFKESAACLDMKRLGKQRVEALQILQTLLSPARKREATWSHHPAVLMWQGHEIALCEYGLAICDEWFSRGYRDTVHSQILALHDFLCEQPRRSKDFPTWIGNEKFHSSHRSNLLRKAPEWYSRFGWVEGPDQPYFWPVRYEKAL